MFRLCIHPIHFRIPWISIISDAITLLGVWHHHECVSLQRTPEGMLGRELCHDAFVLWLQSCLDAVNITFISLCGHCLPQFPNLTGYQNLNSAPIAVEDRARNAGGFQPQRWVYVDDFQIFSVLSCADCAGAGE